MINYLDYYHFSINDIQGYMFSFIGDISSNLYLYPER